MLVTSPCQNVSEYVRLTFHYSLTRFHENTVIYSAIQMQMHEAISRRPVQDVVLRYDEHKLVTRNLLLSLLRYCLLSVLFKSLKTLKFFAFRRMLPSSSGRKGRYPPSPLDPADRCLPILPADVGLSIFRNVLTFRGV
jgi:hypothetical protein